MDEEFKLNTIAAADMPASDGSVDPEASSKHRRLSPAQRREDFIRKATTLFAEEGFDAGTRELARKLGVTHPCSIAIFPARMI